MSISRAFACSLVFLVFVGSSNLICRGQGSLSESASSANSDQRVSAALLLENDGASPNLEKTLARAVEPEPRSLTPVEQARRERIARCLAIYYTKNIDADVLHPWSIMHGLIAYGDKTQILVQGQLVDAIAYLCANGNCGDMQLLYLENGNLKTRQGPGVQGHEGQLLAMLAQSNVAANYPITVESQKFTVADLIEYEMKGCRSDSELTFKLISLAHYLEPDASWTNEQGEDWDMSRLISEELQQPVYRGACGGSHRLTALCYAVDQQLKRGQPLEGPWLKAARVVDSHVRLTWNLQNSDGSYSTKWFTGRGADPDRTRRLYTTGHILEWLVLALPESSMNQPRITSAVDYLLDLMLTTPGFQLDVGPRGHALHALAMYERKAYGSESQYRQLEMTEEEIAIAAMDPESAKSKAASAQQAKSLNNNGNRRGGRQRLFRRR